METPADRAAADAFLDREVSNHVRCVYRITSFDLAGNVGRVDGVGVADADPLPRLRRRCPLAAARRLEVEVRNATYYNMQVWRDGRKLRSVWPGRSQYRLRSSWTFQGRRHMLSGGQVTVYVWAGFGSKAAANYGPLYGQTRFTVGSCVSPTVEAGSPTRLEPNEYPRRLRQAARGGPPTTGNDWGREPMLRFARALRPRRPEAL